METKNIFASFVLTPTKGGYAATTRAADRGEEGKIGLPGGKVDPGETARDAVIREAKEEGWDIFNVSQEPFHIAEVEGKMVAWFTADDAVALSTYKESNRIKPIVRSIEQIAQSGYGNDIATLVYLDTLN